MGNKIKKLWAFVLFSSIGFLSGMMANIICFEAVPFLQRIFPQLLQMTWVIWGLIGAFLSVAGCLLYAVNMSKRLKFLGLFAIMGFLLGVTINVFYFNALPIMITLLPQIFAVPWIAWGIVGAFLSMVCCLIYAYLP